MACTCFYDRVHKDSSNQSSRVRYKIDLKTMLKGRILTLKSLNFLCLQVNFVKVFVII